MAMFEIWGTDSIGVLARVEGIADYSLAQQLATLRLASEHYPGSMYGGAIGFPNSDISNSTGAAMMLNPNGVFKALVAESDDYDPEAEADTFHCDRCSEDVLESDECSACDNCNDCCTCDKYYCEGCGDWEDTQCGTCERCDVDGGCCRCFFCDGCDENCKYDDGQCGDCSKCLDCCDCERCDNCGDSCDSKCEDGYGECCCDEDCNHETDRWERAD